MTSAEGRMLLKNLLTTQMRQQLQQNGLSDEDDHVPVARLFSYDNKWSWLLVLQDQEDPDKVLCLADLGIGQPEVGYIRLSWLADYDIQGIPIYLDTDATLDKPLSWYANKARANKK